MAASLGIASGPALQSALRKARWRIVPLLAVCYLVAFMDRVNISFAAETMNRDLHFTPKIYGLGAGLFFVTYALCEIPSSQMLLRFGARRWLSRIMLTWGLIAVAMVFVRTPWSFYGMRLLLGVAEAGYFPGAIFFLSQWFPAGQRARTISYFYIAFPLSNLVMGGLAGVLLRQNGRLGLRGWQWLFFVEALPAVVLSVVMWFALPDTPSTATWLNEEEREALVTELARGRRRKVEQVEATGSGLRRALTSGKVWMIGLYFFFTLGASYALSFFLPVILRGLTHWDAGRVGYLLAGWGMVGAVAMLGNAALSDRRRELKYHILVPTVVVGLAYLAAGMHLAGWGAVALLFVAVTAYYSLQGPITSLPSWVFAGDAEAVAIAVMTMCGIAGGFVGPYAMGWLREATGSYAVGVGALCVPVLLAAVCMVALLRTMKTDFDAETRD